MNKHVLNSILIIAIVVAATANIQVSSADDPKPRKQTAAESPSAAFDAFVAAAKKDDWASARASAH